MSSPRGINERIDWFLSHNPSSRGMCAQHSWHSLGGDSGNPPAWGCSDANECVDKVKQSDRAWTKVTWYGDPPVGAWVGYKYGSNGHAAIKHHNAGKIATTDPADSSKMVGIEGLSYPNKWGANGWTVWTDEYNNVRFPVAKSAVYLSKLKHGQEDSDSVGHLQARLNAIPLSGGTELPLSGNYFDQTKAEVAKWQQQKAKDSSVFDGSHITDAQAEELFADDLYEIYDDTPDEVPPDVPPIEEEEVIAGFGIWKWYSGKPGGTFVLPPDGEWHDLRFTQPDSDISEESSEFHFLYLRLELDASRSADKVLQTKFVRSDSDATAYDARTYGTTLDSYPYFNMHIESGAGIGGTWYAKVSGGTSPIEITTRYAKTHVLYQQEL